MSAAIDPWDGHGAIPCPPAVLGRPREEEKAESEDNSAKRPRHPFGAGLRMTKPLSDTGVFFVCLSCIYYPATCGPKGHGSGGVQKKRRPSFAAGFRPGILQKRDRRHRKRQQLLNASNCWVWVLSFLRLSRLSTPTNTPPLSSLPPFRFVPFPGGLFSLFPQFSCLRRIP